jgi:hypothetical protein
MRKLTAFLAPLLWLSMPTAPAWASYRMFDQAGLLAAVGESRPEAGDATAPGAGSPARVALLDGLIDPPSTGPGGLALDLGGAGVGSFELAPALATAPFESLGPDDPASDALPGTGVPARSRGTADLPADAPVRFSIGSRRPASFAMLATGLAWVGLSMSRSRGHRGMGRGVAGRRHPAGMKRTIGRTTAPRPVREINLRVTPAELTALEWLRDECAGPDGFDEAKAAAGIRQILGAEVVDLLCSGVETGDRRTVKLRLHGEPERS